MMKQFLSPFLLAVSGFCILYALTFNALAKEESERSNLKHSSAVERYLARNTSGAKKTSNLVVVRPRGALYERNISLGSGNIINVNNQAALTSMWIPIREEDEQSGDFIWE